MSRTRLATAAVATSLLVCGAALIPAHSAYALPHLEVHQHPQENNDRRVMLEVYNKSSLFRDLKIDGQIYTVLPHHSLAIKAPEGTPVFINTTGSMHRKGDLLFSIDPSMKNKVLPID